MNISVIIPVYNGGENFRICLEAVQRLKPPAYELIVVADGDTDDSRGLATQYGAEVLVLPYPHGPAYARNSGAAQAKSQWLFFLDADVAVHENAIEMAQALLTEKPDIAALIGSYDDAPLANTFISQYKNLMHHYVHQTSNEEASTFWGACGVIKKEVFEQIGGFDAERYERPSIEDIELGIRLKAQGYRIQLAKGLLVKHLKKWTVRSMLKSDLFDRAIPWTRLILEGADLYDLNLGWTSRISTLLVFLCVFCLFGSPFLRLAWVGLLIGVVALLMLNYPVYYYMYSKRGAYFAARSILWHWFYYLYSGLTFASMTFLYKISPKTIAD